MNPDTSSSPVGAAERPAGASWRALAVTAALLTLPGLAAPATAQQTTWGGEVRPRFEIRDPVDDGTRAFTSMRTRVSLARRLAPEIGVFIQVQDVRFWGEELGTTDTDANGFDLHQGWVEFGQEDRSPLWIRVGRQESPFGEERLVGALNWAQSGRSFDGVRAAAGLGALRVDLFGYQLAEEASASFDSDASFLGAYGVADLGPGRTLDIYTLHDRTGDDTDVERVTLGSRYAAAHGPWSYRVEGAWQTGEAAELDISAWMLTARLTRELADGRAGVTLWYDHLSGDADPTDDELGVFNTLFATNHGIYGTADLFLNIPVNTGGKGLRDFALKTRWDATPDVRLRVDLHHFRAADDTGLSTARYGEEIDVEAAWSWADGMTLSGGMAYVFQNDALAEIGRLDEDMIWGYAMVTAAF